MKACFFTTNPENRLRFVFDGRQKEFEKRLELLPEPVLLSEMEEKRAQLAEVEVILSTWGMPALTEAQVRNSSQSSGWFCIPPRRCAISLRAIWTRA